MQAPCSSPTILWPCACWAAPRPPPWRRPPYRANSSRLRLPRGLRWPSSGSGRGSLSCRSNTRHYQTATTEPCLQEPVPVPEEKPTLTPFSLGLTSLAGECRMQGKGVESHVWCYGAPWRICWKKSCNLFDRLDPPERTSSDPACCGTGGEKRVHEL